MLIVLLLVDFGALAPLSKYINAYPVFDSLIHFVMYGILALVANAALACRRRGSLTRAIATGSIFVFVAATVEECSNLVVPCRGWAVSDLAANYLGILLLGIVPVSCLLRKTRLEQMALPEL
jgi:VanZ family protein